MKKRRQHYSRWSYRSAALKKQSDSLSDRNFLIMFPKKIHKQKFEECKQKQDWKPEGLWYGCGLSWINWCFSEQPNWITDYIYKIHFNRKRIRTIKTVKELERFHETYKIVLPYMKDKKVLSKFCFNMDWKKLAKRYDGIEINPYQFSKRFEYSWYYGWDCASGCIWRKRAIRKIELVLTYNQKRRQYVKAT